MLICSVRNQKMRKTHKVDTRRSRQDDNLGGFVLMKLKPLFDKVVVKKLEEKEQSVGGIFLPTAAQEKQEVAEVVAVGEGGMIDGKEVKMVVKPGDKVLYSKYAGSQFKVDGEEVTIVKQSDILAIVE